MQQRTDGDPVLPIRMLAITSFWQVFYFYEFDSYQNKIEQVGKGLIGLNSEKENIDENLILQDKLWKIAIKKSYFIPDSNDEDASNESVQKKLMELLKNKYPDV